MKCDICKINDATIHLTEVINEQVTKLHICENCAKEKSMEMQSQFGLSDLLSGLMDFTPAVSGEESGQTALTECSVCRMTYRDFQKTGRLGCGNCYETFQKELSELLRKIHGADRHVGKMPYMGQDKAEAQDEIRRLKEELTKLVSQEEFEKAALIRDRIKELENTMEKQTSKTRGADENK